MRTAAAPGGGAGRAAHRTGRSALLLVTQNSYAPFISLLFFLAVAAVTSAYGAAFVVVVAVVSGVAAFVITDAPGYPVA